MYENTFTFIFNVKFYLQGFYSLSFETHVYLNITFVIFFSE